MVWVWAVKLNEHQSATITEPRVWGANQAQMQTLPRIQTLSWIFRKYFLLKHRVWLKGLNAFVGELWQQNKCLKHNYICVNRTSGLEKSWNSAKGTICGELRHQWSHNGKNTLTESCCQTEHLLRKPEGTQIYCAQKVPWFNRDRMGSSLYCSRAQTLLAFLVAYYVGASSQPAVFIRFVSGSYSVN